MPLPPSFPTARWLELFDALLRRSTPEEVSAIAATVGPYAPELVPLLVEHALRDAALLPPGRERLDMLLTLKLYLSELSSKQRRLVRPLFLPCLSLVQEKDTGMGASLVAWFGQPGDEARLPKPWDHRSVQSLKSGFAARGWEREARALVSTWIQQAPPEKRFTLWLDLIDDYQPKPIDQWLLYEARRVLTESTSFEETAQLAYHATLLGQRALAHELLTQALRRPKQTDLGWRYLGMCVGTLGAGSPLSKIDPGDYGEKFYSSVLSSTSNKELALAAARLLLSPRVRNAKNADTIYRSLVQSVDYWHRHDSKVEKTLYALLEGAAPPEIYSWTKIYQQRWRLRNDPAAQLREIRSFPSKFIRETHLSEFITSCLRDGLPDAARRVHQELTGNETLSSKLEFGTELQRYGYTAEVQAFLQKLRPFPLRRFSPEQVESMERVFSEQVDLALFLVQNQLPEGRTHLLALRTDVRAFRSWLITVQHQKPEDAAEACENHYRWLVEAFETAELWDDAFATIAEISNPIVSGELLGKLGHVKLLLGVA